MKIDNLPVDLCYGCSACASICPNEAIEMRFDERGEYRPLVASSKCVDCGMCVNICKSLHSPQSVPAISREAVYVAVAKDRSVLKNSSSGGIGYILAKKGIEKGCSVCGVQYDSVQHSAAHCVCETQGDLFRIQGSKYLISANAAAFIEILKRDSGVIFGTPCQIAGAAKVLEKRKKRDRFVLVDIFCHGVPNQLLWLNHLTWISKRKQIADRSIPVFRNGKEFRLSLDTYHAWYNEDAFYTFFLRGWLYNQSCYTCPFRRNSLADIRIGDCMVPKYESLPFSPSCVVVNTPRGERYLQACAGELELYLEDYSVIDTIQEKENRQLPANYKKRLCALQQGTAPDVLIRKTMICGRMKSFVKHKVLMALKKGKKGKHKNLRDLIG